MLTEIPCDENPKAHSNAGTVPPPPTPALSRRSVLVAAGVGLGTVVVTSVGQTVTPLEPVGGLAIRQKSKGPQGVPANVIGPATSPGWLLTVTGPAAYTLSLEQVLDAATAEDDFPITCVEGWSAGAHWRARSG